MDMKFLQPATKEEAGGIEKNNICKKFYTVEY